MIEDAGPRPPSKLLHTYTGEPFREMAKAEIRFVFSEAFGARD
jgi:hypothetical protein